MGDPANQAKSIFLAAIEEHAPEQWPAFLDEACAGNAALRAEVEKLLQARAELGSYYEAPQRLLDHDAPTTGAGVGATGTVAECPGTLIGPYKLLQQVGEGGMGTVFMAEQQHPVQRKVALKVIKPGMDSRQVVARFEAERQALALMDHPHIARVLDAGTTGDGRPYFVMELVKGVPITRYCDEHRLTPRERLGLFVGVCQAVQHAHQKGIIHRDLKPSNVLVAPYDGRPVPKVIDFGIAKATGPKLTERTLFTEFGAVVGTLEYMSPEQAEVNQLDIDTRSDVYSLGVLLYELLTGTTPLQRKRLKQVALLEVLRLIREEEPPKPSTRLSTTEELPAIASNRGLEPKRLSGLVRGELDWIVMKCLEKDRDRRYESANGLAQDIRRYLHDEPVQACPPGTGYRLRKFVRRNRGPVLAAGLVLLALVGGVVGTSIGLVRAEAARKAEAVQKEEAERAGELARERLEEVTRAKERTEEKADIARAVNEFLQSDLLGQAYVGNQLLLGGAGERNPNITVGELLDRAAREIEGKFADKPLTEAAIRLTLGATYRGLGRYAEALPHLERSVRLRTAHLGIDDPDTLDSRNALAVLHVARGRPDLPERPLQEVLKASAARLGANHPNTLMVKHNLAWVYRARAKYDLAEQLYKEIIGVYTARGLDRHPPALLAKNNLATVHAARANYHLAEPLYEEVLRAQTAQQGADHPATLLGKNNLAMLYQQRGQYDRAESLYNKVIAVQTTTLGADHPDTLTTRHNLALLHQARGKYDLAEPRYRAVIEARTQKLGAKHPSTLLSKHNLAGLYLQRRRFDLAEPLFQEVLAARIDRLGADHPDTLHSQSSLGWMYYLRGKLDLAEPHYKEVLAARVARLGADHPDTVKSKNLLAQLYGARGQYDRAEPLFREAVQAATARLRGDHPITLKCKNNLAGLYWRMRKLDRSVPLFEEVVRDSTARLGADHPETLLSTFNLAVNYRDAGRLADAVARLDESLPRARAGLPPESWVRNFGVRKGAETYALAGRHDKAEPLLRELAGLARQQAGPQSPPYAERLAGLGLNLLRQKKYADAEPLLRECLAICTKHMPDDWLTFNTRSMLGAVLAGRKKYAEAEPLLVQGYEGMKQREAKIPTAWKICLTEALERLVGLYEAMGQKDKAAGWRKKLEEWKAGLKKPKP
jgi:eukaryotic-like serine/threonine-protein kinase